MGGSGDYSSVGRILAYLAQSPEVSLQYHKKLEMMADANHPNIGQ